MQDTFSKIVMVGLGYIGLPTAALIAKNKIKVLGVDVQQKVVDTINQGKIHIVEPDLAQLEQEHPFTRGRIALVKPQPTTIAILAFRGSFGEGCAQLVQFPL